jgi:hypothetical protein
MALSLRGGFVRMATPFQTACAANSLRQTSLELDAAALQFGFDPVKDDLG